MRSLYKKNGKKNALFTKKMPYDHRKKPEKLYFRLDFFNEKKNINKIKTKTPEKKTRLHRKPRSPAGHNVHGYSLVASPQGVILILVAKPLGGILT